MLGTEEIICYLAIAGSLLLHLNWHGWSMVKSVLRMVHLKYFDFQFPSQWGMGWSGALFTISEVKQNYLYFIIY